MKVGEMSTVFRESGACFRRYRRMSLGCCLSFALAVPAYAIEGVVRVSDFDGAVQIWFEAEDFDERIPDTENFFPIVDADGAFGEAMSRAGDAGGCIRWDFDISEADGRAGEWYMWARVVNPNNRSDYLLVEGDPGDLEIPDEEPYPGGKDTPPFVDDDDRALEDTIGDCAILFPEYVDCTWGWIDDNRPGHIKELRDGENSMFLFDREGNSSRLLDVIMWTDSRTYRPTDEHYLQADLVNAPPCEDPPDTHCLGLTVEGPDGELVAGIYTATVDAEDDSDDPIRYLLTADNGVDPPVISFSLDNNVLLFVLEEGTWTISVTVDDDLACADAAADNTCVLDPFEVLPAVVEPPRRPETPFRISDIDGAVQIWFEAEDFQERIPDDDTYYPIVFEFDAFNEEAMSRAGGAGGCIRWDFDISAADGEAGTWYMWGRVINPSNQSDYILVEGDPDDQKIPVLEPYPGGDGTPPFVNEDDRVFEGNVGPPFGWFGGTTQGHIKELRDGVNSMFMFHRQGNSDRLLDVIMWTDSSAYQPSDEHYEAADEFVHVPPDPRLMFHRGDADADGAINITDAVSILNFLFSGGPDATCKEAQDFDNDGSVIITDAVAILGFLFGSGPPPAAPGPTTEPCGRDPDAPNTAGDLGCTAYTSCAQ